MLLDVLDHECVDVQVCFNLERAISLAEIELGLHLLIVCAIKFEHLCVRLSFKLTDEEAPEGFLDDEIHLVQGDKRLLKGILVAPAEVEEESLEGLKLHNQHRGIMLLVVES